MAASGWASRAITAAVQLMSVRLLLTALGVESYAVFALLTGLQGWFLLADFGLGPSTQNFVSEARAHGIPSDAVIATARTCGLLLMVVASAGVALIAPFVAPVLLAPFPDVPTDRKTTLFLLTGCIAVSSAIGGIIYKIWFAQHRGYLSNGLPAAAALIGLGGLSFAHRIPVEYSVFYCLIVFAGPSALLPLVALLFHPAARRVGKTHVELIRSGLTRDIVGRGLRFWMFAVLAALTLQVDYLMISQFLGATDIAIYAMTTKIFGLALFLHTSALAALWPVFAELGSQRKWEGLWMSFRRFLTFGVVVMCVSCGVIMACMPAALRVLAPGQALHVPLGLMLIFTIYQIVRVWTDFFGMLLQSLNHLRPFWILVPFQAVISIGAQWVLVPRYGLYGVLCGLILSFISTVSWGLPLAARRLMRPDQARVLPSAL